MKDCTLAVEDQRNGKRWSFEHINLSLTRPPEGGIAFAVNSTGADGLWSLTATVTPKPDGRRTIETVIRDVSPKDLMLALRIPRSDTFSPTCRSPPCMRAEIERDGTLQVLEGRVLAGAGDFGSRGDADSRVHIDEAQAQSALESCDPHVADADRGAIRSEPGQSRRPAGSARSIRQAPWTLAIPRGVIVSRVGRPLAAIRR